MSDVLAIAEAGMRSQLAALDTISHNVANVGTHGFKREIRASAPFEAQLTSAQSVEAEPAVRDFSAGALRNTGSPLQFAIEGEGWFQLRSPQGVVLTRNGAFELDRSGKLVSQQGWPVVLDSEASLGSATPSLTASNELWVNGERVARLILATADPSTLQAVGAGMYRSSQKVEDAPGAGTVRQGFLEASNVDTLSEMLSLMQAMRGAETSQRVIRAYDEALDTALTTLGEF